MAAILECLNQGLSPFPLSGPTQSDASTASAYTATWWGCGRRRSEAEPMGAGCCAGVGLEVGC